MNNGFIVCVQYTSASYIVVVPCGEKFCGKMDIIVACHFDNKGWVLC